MKLIIHPGTQTVIDAAECLILDTSLLSADELAVLNEALYADSDEQIVEFASALGLRLAG